MLTIQSLTLENWKCYRGKQRLDLEPTTYAIVARMRDNPKRSNYLGKSSVGHAVDFALYGQKPPDCRTIRDAISKGEKKAQVELVLSDGSRVLRMIGASESAKTKFWAPGAEKPAEQDEAEKAIERLLGISAKDFRATCYVRQRELAGLVLCEPADRMELVSSWLRLEKLDFCIDESSTVLGELGRRRAEANEQAARAEQAGQESLRRLADTLGCPLDEAFARLEHVVRQHEEAAKAAADEYAAWEERTRYGREISFLKPHAERYAELVKQGSNLAAQYPQEARPELFNELKKREQDAARDQQHVRAYEESSHRLRLLLVGEFDGECPLAKAPCPSAQFVTEERERNEQNLNCSEINREDAARFAQQSLKLSEEARATLAAHDAAQERLRVMRQEAKQLKPYAERWDREWPAGEHSGESGVDLRAVAGVRLRTAAQVAQFVGVFREHEEQAQSHRAEAERIGRAVDVAAAGLAVFRRARQEIAEQVLVDIEARACGELALLGTDLQVALTWEREGKGLAQSCERCGAPFPRSERVKQCERCGAERGPNVVQKLELVPSRTSGGAEDLAGLSVMLGAAAWLRHDRSSPWAVAILDEIFGHLDEAHRGAVASGLPRMLAGAGFDQAFVVAHHASVLDALPGRIVVESDGEWSTVRVER